VDFAIIADNLRESFRVLASGRSNGEVRELRGVSIASAGVTFQMFNAAFLSAPVASETELAQRIFLASLHFEQRGQEWAYWVCEDWMDARLRKRARRLFDKYGLHHTVDLPGMLAERIAQPAKGLPPLEVRRVDCAATRDAFCAIGSICFNVPLSWFREVFETESVWNRFAGYVGYRDQEPIATAAVVIADGVAGIYNVATIPGYQRLGYGEVMMRYVLAAARGEHGIERSILQSTPAGYRLYERMGYQRITTVGVYST
jgi:ribosomal protein S18 acetylase RimI-like enzyme